MLTYTDYELLVDGVKKFLFFSLMISLFDDFLQWFVLWNEIVAVTMQAQKEAPPDFQCKDKFLLLSVVAPDGATAKDIGPDMVGPLLLFFFFF